MIPNLNLLQSPCNNSYNYYQPMSYSMPPLNNYFYVMFNPYSEPTFYPNMP